MDILDRFTRRARFAYFSMEIALRPEVHTYSGGLGVLAGDSARSAADLNLPMVFITLVSRQGYVRQEIGNGHVQVSHPDPWEPEAFATPLPSMVAVTIEERPVWIRPWLYTQECPLGHSIPVLLLDTDVEQNADEDRRITDTLYGGDREYRLKQEIVLGIGGHAVLRALGFAIEKYHMNEGHAALLTLPLLRATRAVEDTAPAIAKRYDIGAVRDQCVFTTHTPVDAGFDKFDYTLVARVLGDFIEPEILRDLAGQEELNMTRLALNLSSYVNGVARRHAETTRTLFPGYTIASITNGVHVHKWMHNAIASLYEESLPNWAHEPEVLAFADHVNDSVLWNAHQSAKADLLDVIAQTTGRKLRLDLPLIGYARRMTAYKRPELLFSDVASLRDVAQDQPFQIVMAGLAHPSDIGGQDAIRAIGAHMDALEGTIPIVFLPGYNLERATSLVSGCDIWLNTPLPPLEASGTSGMKAAINGVLNLSVLDGWWVEGCVDGVTGWSLETTGSPEGDARALYDKLRDVVLPMYHGDRSGWIRMMKQSISKIGPSFNSHRMMRRYATEAYLR
ncbi:alpha-glucan family phosphorylase [Brucella anthropi]|uniref:alpha-glucan family phosphorylase n=1 Tax=Brucella anthropi TaxID=529 RepID=UPI001AEF4EB3|nr:alpha-glucan family phosphorylase [Brucella anthropi]